MLRSTVILSLVQGMAEWLPISSSGHLVIFRHFFGLEGNLSLDVFLHLSSLLVIIIFFRHQLARIFQALRQKRQEAPEFRVTLFVLAGSAMTAAVGLLLKQWVDAFSTLPTIGIAYLVNAALLFFSRQTGNREIDLSRALLIGLVQALAVLPGLSRSGSTIAVGLISGLSGPEAFRFSFLLAIPALAGAGLIEARNWSSSPPRVLLVGFSVCFLVSFFSISLLQKLVVRNKLHWFAFYCLSLGLILLLKG
ncbi:MAG: undecaprenyl-diphosphate phosphatase [Candidatus Omnitrophica bacterium]|nr:undecaprenyl-diphosphate phosphatase [Candidatus Omnitrophota bacterium]